MPLAAHEVIVGNVAILDGDSLFANTQVDHGPRTDKRVIGHRPFLCIESDGSHCSWVMLTTQYNPKRLLLDQWKVPGSPKWMRDTQYLCDAREVLRGPVSAFVTAGKDELPHKPHIRHGVSQNGIDAVFREIEKYS